MRTNVAAPWVSLSSLASLIATAIAFPACSGSGSAGNVGGSSGGSESSSGASSSSSGGSASGSSGSGGNGSSGSGSSGTGPTGNGSSGSSGSGSSGTASSTGSSGAGTSSGGGADGGTVTSAYPSGPYCAPAGTNGTLPVGCVVPNMSWIGYDDEAASVVATTEPYVTYTLDDARKSGKRYLMINLAEFDCPGCQNSATALGTLDDAGVSEGSSVVEAGGVVIEVLETAGFVAIASMTDLTSWVNKYSLMVTTVKDPDSSSGTPTLSQFGHRDQAYIVDMTTMKIIQVLTGSEVADGDMNSAPEAMAAMHTLLGK